MASTNLFKISNFKFQFRDSTQLELMTTAVNFPGLQLGEIRIERPTVLDRRPGDSMTYDDLKITALCDETLDVYKEVYKYLVLSANPQNADLNPFDPVFDCTLFLTTNKNNIQHTINFYNCFFKSIGEVDMTSGSTDETHFSFNINLGFSYYLFEGLE